MSLKTKYGSLALVAGASEGIGEAFSHYLASQGLNVILVARREEPLALLAQKLSTTYNIHAESLPLDLSSSTAPVDLVQKLEGRSIDLFVYNAAISYIGHFEDHSIADHTRMAQLNMITPLNLVHAIGRDMLKQGKGAVIIMASMAGLQGTGHITTYAATKAFDRVLAESLWFEWKNRGVDVLGCIAGATTTPGFIKSNPSKLKFGNPSLQTADQVVKECFDNLGKRPSFISGRSNRFATFLMQRLFPRKWAVNIIGSTTSKMYRIDS